MDTFSHAMRTALLSKADPDSGLIPLPAFIETALYEPHLGYYAQTDRHRVGRSSKTDFYTAASLGEVFGRLVMEAATDGLHAPPEETAFVEFGPESERGVLGKLTSPFKEIICVRPGQTFHIPSPAVVFSNELFDAQPFRRFQFDGTTWLEAAVASTIDETDAPSYTLIYTAPLSPLPPLPSTPPIGYTVDWPSGALALLSRICEQPWEGRFIALDYGLMEHDLLHLRPQGTARAYAQHRLDNDFLSSPGTRDITCHIAWDPLESILRAHQFQGLSLLRQETFFMRHAPSTIEKIVLQDPTSFSPERMTLMEILHPQNMGSRFQVLSGSRILS
ncbi:MAG: hypothetical protein RL648_1182 [Verrucomicrobiota bacterium]